MAMHATAHYLLEGLKEVGIDYLFCNLGTDHAPIVEEMARWRRHGLVPPEVVLCPHEVVAMHMAGGYAMATGRGQAVLAHVDAGTANSTMGMHNLFRTRVPVLLLAGKAPFTSRGELVGSRDTYVNFVQEPFDMSSLVRPYVKWSYDLPSGLITKEVIRRAHSIMHSDAMGPAYLTVARETLTALHHAADIRAFSARRFGPLRAHGIDDDTIHAIADRLMAADDPILITAYAGRDRRTPALIERLAQLCGMRVYESNPLYLNVSRTSPCFAGFATKDVVAQADFGLLLDVDVPWLPKFSIENPDAFWVHVDVDALKKDCPMWSFPGDIRVQADSGRVLERLLAILETKASSNWTQAAALRSAKSAKLSAQTAGARRQALTSHAGRMSAALISAALAEAIDEDAIVVQEAITNAVPVCMNLPRTRPGTYFANGGGGLGFGGGTALGVKLASPDRLVVHVTGDGSFCFSAPSAVYAVAARYRLPIFTVVLDNSGWGAVEGATRRLYPDGEAVAAQSFHADYTDGMRWEKVAEAAGAYGERVDHPNDLASAIGRCLDAVAHGRSAVLVATLDKVSRHGEL
jgi:acetolactate synthase-1/2/3 large subunit